MLSILIPIYNRDVRKLVNSLYEQAEKADIPFEFLCYDDGSKEKYKLKNREISSLFSVSYMELSQNLGRSKIRNWLAKNARYEHLLFLDCDQYVHRRTFVQKYLEALRDHSVVYGGTTYKKSPPAKSVRLHWKYGRKVESQSVQTRMRAPNINFRSNNFVIERGLFLKSPFDENIRGYGYEDSMIGMALAREGYEIKHIDNPVEHAGLEKTAVFLNKTKEAMHNLVSLHRDHQLRTRLTNLHERLMYWGVMPLLSWMYKKREAAIEKNLYSENPNLILFQLYKLMTFHQAKR